MAINLQKGGRIDLSKESTASVFRIGLGWDAAQPGKEFDLDAMAILQAVSQGWSMEVPSCERR